MLSSEKSLDRLYIKTVHNQATKKSV